MKKILVFFTLLSISFAANLTIDQLPVAGGVGGQEVLPFVQGGQTRQVSINKIISDLGILRAGATLNSIVINELSGTAPTTSPFIIYGEDGNKSFETRIGDSKFYNMFMGLGSGMSLVPTTVMGGTGRYNVGLGVDALRLLTTGGSNTAIGYQAAYGSTNKNFNTAIGHTAMYAGGGDGNVAVGHASLLSATSGYNTAIGYKAASSLSTGSYNTAVGHNALVGHTTGQVNVGIGAYACAITSGEYNIGIGLYSLVNSSGTRNIGIGSGAGNNVGEGSRNIYIGDNAMTREAGLSNRLNIGDLIYGNNLNGGLGLISSGNIGIGIVSPSYKLEVDGSVSASSAVFNGTVTVNKLVDLNGSYAQMIITYNALTFVPTNVYTTYNVGWIDSITKNMTTSTTAGTMLLSEPGLYQISYGASLDKDNDSDDIEIGVSFNGADPSPEMEVRIDNTTAGFNTIGGRNGLARLSVGTVIAIKIKNISSNSRYIVLRNGNLMARRVGEY